MKVDTDQIWVVVANYQDRYSLDTHLPAVVYLTKETAQAACDEQNVVWAGRITYHVETLMERLDTLADNIRFQGQQEATDRLL